MISMKLFPPLSSDVSSRSRISARRVGRPNQSSITADYSSHFSGMNGSVVISTRSNGSPTCQNFGTCMKCKCVSCFDLCDLPPSNVSRRNRVNNPYTFIGNFQSWPLYDTVNEYSNEGTHQCSPKQILNVASKNRLEYCSKEEKVPKYRSDKPRFWSKDFSVFHAGSPLRRLG